MPRPPLTVTIITLNEERNLPRLLRSLSWLTPSDEILIVDSGSTDKTLEIARSAGARVLSNPWKGYGQQKNFAQTQARNDWVLSLDADEAVSPGLATAVSHALEAGGAPGFSFPRKTYYLGRWVRHGGWYPSFITRLADRRFARWSEPAVHEELIVEGGARRLTAPLDHYAFPSIEEQVTTNLRFSRLGTEALRAMGRRPSLFKLVFKPLGKFVETYFWKRGFLDGARGFIISINAAYSLFLKYAYFIEPELRDEDSDR